MYPNILAECARNGTTKQELATKLSVSSKTLYNWLNGKTKIPGPTLKEMSLMWGVTIEYLLEEECPNQPRAG